MLKELSRLHLDSSLSNEASRDQQVIIWLVTISAVLAVLQNLEHLISWMLTKIYELVIQKNIFNL